MKSWYIYKREKMWVLKTNTSTRAFKVFDSKRKAVVEGKIRAERNGENLIVNGDKYVRVFFNH